MGLGHATRSLPIIRKYLANHNVYIISNGDALNFLKGELEGSPIKFFTLQDYPPLQRGRGLLYYLYLAHDFAVTTLIIKRESEFVNKIVQEYDIDWIISDGRCGSYSKQVPCYLISHQIRFMTPKILRIFQLLVDLFSIFMFSRFDGVLIPDYASPNNLAGRMSHNWITRHIRCHYIGILSSYYDLGLEQDIDYLFVVSGFLEEQKKSFVNALIKQSEELPGKKVFVLGDTRQEFHKVDAEHNIEIYFYALGQKRLELFNRAKFIISRCGYTTVMDLVEMGKKGLLFPTKNQVEQEYLQKYLQKNKYFLTCDSETDFDLKKLLAADFPVTEFVPDWKTAQSLTQLEEAVKHVHTRVASGS